MKNSVKIKKSFPLLIAILINWNVQSQIFDGNLASKSLKWSLEQKDFASPPRVGIEPMSIKLWNNYKGANSPSEFGSLLEINGMSGHLVSQMYFNSTWEGGRILYRSAFYDQTTWNEWRYLLDSKSDVESDGLLKIKGAGNSYVAGNVGIGILIPTEKLDVVGNAKLSSYSPTLILQRDTDVGGYTQGIQTKLKDGSNNWYFGNLLTGSWIVSKGDFQNPKMVVLDGGNVGIGSTNPDSKLTVKGKIHAEEVKVDLAVPADYVFEKYYLGESSLKRDYTLLTLSEVEKFTEANHHLPNVPSAKEIKENGLLLGEMSNVLLQKVEELTLYAIDQQKTISKQTETIEKLKKENESFKKLEERLNKIEKELETKK